MAYSHPSIRPISKKLISNVIIILGGICGSLIMYWMIGDFGPGVNPDSTVYFAAAKNLINGNGLYVGDAAMTHYPPGYPILLSVISFFTNFDVFSASKIVAILIFGLNLILFATAVQNSTNYSPVAVLLSILVFLISDQNLYVHARALSEGPYLTFSLAALLMVSAYITRPRNHLLILGAVFAGFAVLMRYAGIILIPTIQLLLLFMERDNKKKKFVDILIFSTLSSLPILLWLLRNYLTVQNLTNRSFISHHINRNHLWSLVNTIYSSYLPINIPLTVKAFHLALLVGTLSFALFYLYREKGLRFNKSSVNQVTIVCYSLYSILYMVFILFSISFIDAYTPINYRILMPGIFAISIGGLSIIWLISKSLQNKSIIIFSVLVVLFSVSINTNNAYSEAKSINKTGIGYSAIIWQRSKIIAYLEDHKFNKKIYTNGPDVFRFFLDEEVYFIPRKTFPNTLQENGDYEQEINQMLQECRDGSALVVYFYNINRDYLPNKNEIMSTGDLPILIVLKDGVILGTED